MSDVDDIIRERLRKLRRDEQHAAGTSVHNHQASSIVNPPRKTNVEQVEDLLAKLTDEVSLDDTCSKDKSEIDAQIRRRLERLKEWDLGPPRANFEIGSMKTVPDVVNALLSRPDFQVNSSKDEDDGDSGKMSADESGTSSEDSDAPPTYCVFCKSEPSVVCVDCYKDSYCTKCFNEFHVPEDKHSTIKYVQKKKK